MKKQADKESVSPVFFFLGTELHGFHGKRMKKNLCFPCNPVLGKKQIIGEF